MTIFAGGSLALPSGINRGVPTNVRCVLCIAVIAYNTLAATYSRDVPFEFVYFKFAMFFPPMRSPNRLFGRRGECRRILPDEFLHAHRPLPR
jgi:hypothetical protein